MQAEVENQNETAAEVRVRHTLLDANGQAVAQFSSSPKTIEAGQSAIFDDTYTGISKPHLWSMADPYLLYGRYPSLQCRLAGRLRSDEHWAFAGANGQPIRAFS